MNLADRAEELYEATEDYAEEITKDFLDLNDENKSKLRTLWIVIIPVVALYLFSAWRLFYLEMNWGAYFIVMRAVFLAMSIIFILLFSDKSFEFQIISITIIIIVLIVDIIAQALGWYEIDTSTASLEYDFFSHTLAGLITMLILIHLLRIKFGNEELWLFVISSVIGVAWELMEFIVNFINFSFLGGELEGFMLNTTNSLWDILAHTLGTFIALVIYLIYEYARCPPEHRSGIMCKL